MFFSRARARDQPPLEIKRPALQKRARALNNERRWWGAHVATTADGDDDEDGELRRKRKKKRVDTIKRRSLSSEWDRIANAPSPFLPPNECPIESYRSLEERLSSSAAEG